MDVRKIACLAAAGFIGTALTLSATQALSAPPIGDVIVKGQKIDPELQRQVLYSDLNLAFERDQRRLKGRIARTASGLCFDLNGAFDEPGCTRSAIQSTDDQFAAAVERAKLQMAGKPVGPAIAFTMVVGGR